MLRRTTPHFTLFAFVEALFPREINSNGHIHPSVFQSLGDESRLSMVVFMRMSNTVMLFTT